MNHSDKIMEVALVEAMRVTFIHFHENLANVCFLNFFTELIPPVQFIGTYYDNANNNK